MNTTIFSLTGQENTVEPPRRTTDLRGWYKKDDVERRTEFRMDSEDINTAIVAAIEDSAVPRINKEKVLEILGATRGEVLITKISSLVREAAGMSIESECMTLKECVNDILRRFGERYPELSSETLQQIGRCVAWRTFVDNPATQKIAMKFNDTYFSREDRYSLGIEAISNRYYASIPVSNGMADYEEYYEITPRQYDDFLSNKHAAIEFIESCRRRQTPDDLSA
jgi:hypothetical protein